MVASVNSDLIPAVHTALHQSAGGGTEGMKWRYIQILPCFLLWSNLAFAFGNLSSGANNDADFLPVSGEFFGDSRVYRDALQLTIAPGHSGAFTLGWQGCADAGLCYPLQSRKLLSRYGIHGPPTLLWFGPDGQERRARRITGEVKANEFLQRWQTTREDG